MKKYAILLNPGHNRVYFQQSQLLALCEMEIASAKISCTITDIEIVSICDVPYLTFNCENLNNEDGEVLGKLSFFYALFEISKDMFLPLPLPPFKYLDDGISSLLKYSGKTNESFTRMLINLAIFSGDFTKDIKLLDPLAGKGTTLFEGLICGYDVYGVEIGSKVVDEVHTFFRKYLEKEKFKHDIKEMKVSGANKSFSAKRYSFSFAKTKEEYKDNKLKNLEIISCNSVYVDKLYKKNNFDIIVADLPYGVQHSNVTNEKQSSFTRNPKELLSSCLPSWKEVLKPKGVIALSWNSFLTTREMVVNILEDKGFSVFKGGAYEKLEHRVDNSIKRDVVAAQKQ